MKLFRSIVVTAISLVAFIGCETQSEGEEFYLLIGTYTQESSEGIYLYKFDTQTGAIDSVNAAEGIANPSYLAISDDHNFVYAVNEMADSAKATVSAFRFDRENEQLNFLNKQSSGGGAPCYVSIDKTGGYAFVGNYLGGSFSVLPINEDGSLAGASQTITHEGSSVNENRQQNPHVHCTYPAPDNSALVVNDLGIDYVTTYSFDEQTGTISETDTSAYKTTPGAGPRHITFSPDGDYAYLINELDGSVVAFSYEDGLQPLQTVSALPDGFEGAVSGADIHVSPDGEFLYVSMREDLNEIVIFNIDQQNGRLSYVDRQSTNGKHPRNFMIDPTGNYLLTANMNSDNIVVFERDQSTGKLQPTGMEIALSMPVCLKMIPVNR